MAEGGFKTKMVEDGTSTVGNNLPGENTGSEVTTIRSRTAAFGGTLPRNE